MGWVGSCVIPEVRFGWLAPVGQTRPQVKVFAAFGVLQSPVRAESGLATIGFVRDPRGLVGLGWFLLGKPGPTRANPGPNQGPSQAQTGLNPPPKHRPTLIQPNPVQSWAMWVWIGFGWCVIPKVWLNRFLSGGHRLAQVRVFVVRFGSGLGLGRVWVWVWVIFALGPG